jgi:hypothetical protein
MQPVTGLSVLNTSDLRSRVRHGALAVMAGAAVLAALPACDLPFNLGQPTTRALESGAADGLTSARSFEITGSYTDQLTTLTGPASSARTTLTIARVDVDLQLARPSSEHVVIGAAGAKLEAIIIGSDAYFRGHDFLSLHMGSDPLSQNLVRAAGNAWWRGGGATLPALPDFTDGRIFRATFLGPAVTQRTDHVAVDGIDAVELSGPRADVFVAAGSPNELLRVHLKSGVAIDGVSEADLRFGNYDKDFGIAAPTDVIDFSNLSTLTPIYTVVSVDTSGCVSPCAVSALIKNLGGRQAAQAPSTITFTMTASASGQVLGSCKVQVQPDVGFNATTTVGCTIGGNGLQSNSAIVTATADNPGRA